MEFERCGIDFLSMYFYFMYFFEDYLSLSLVLFLTFFIKYSFTVNSLIQCKAQQSTHCRELIKLTVISLSLSLLQGERQDSDHVEERNAQVQLEKAKVLSHRCIMVSPKPTHMALIDSFFREAALKDMITSQTGNIDIRTSD